MKSLVIFASPNQNSFTARLLKEHIDLSVCDIYNCYKEAPKACIGCGKCKSEKTCVFKDLDVFFEKFESCDNIIIAFPVYNGSFPAPLKALIDRFQPFYNARFIRGEKPAIKGRRQVTLIITAGSDKNPLDLILQQLKPLFSITGCNIKQTILLTSTDKLDLKDKLNPTII